MQAAADGSDRNAEHLGDFLVTQPVQIFEHHDRPMIGRQGAQGVLDPNVTLRTLKRERGSVWLGSSGGSNTSREELSTVVDRLFRRRRSLRRRFTAIR